ncbi:HPF/RaiA family ribosome-associated protein [Roseomonas sp. CCTCC AB2023176]|uniref:HPF/RaiA family ribosome-associated protein n=1 Tax=Roseomonas sp. CCTCC AB2023176 TaxID=3342640 RepID=UPI0035D8AF59
MAAPASVEREGRIIVSGHQTDLGDALKTYATAELQKLSEKYFDGAEDITATVSRGGKGNGFGWNIRVHAGRDMYFDGHGDHMANPYTAFNTALERVDKQLRREKRARREDKPTNALKDGLL